MAVMALVSIIMVVLVVLLNALLPDAGPETSATPVEPPTQETAKPEQPEIKALEAPSFDVVRVDPDGNAVVAGRAAPNTAVSILMDGIKVGAALTDSNGTFTALFSIPRSDEPRNLSLVADVGGSGPVASEETVILVPSPDLVDQEMDAVSTKDDERESPSVLLADDEGIRVLQSGGSKPSGVQSVVIDTITYDPEGGISLGGRGSGEGSVRVYLDNEPVQTAEIRADGQWRAPLPEVDTRVYSLRIDQVDDEGNVMSRDETPFKREEPETFAVLDSRANGAKTKAGVVTVQPGNTLWGIASDKYGKGWHYVRVFDANRKNIADPDLIYPGQVFTIPE